jgi:hypothetical protein
VMVGTIGPIGSGLPQFGFPRRFAMKLAFRTARGMNLIDCAIYMILRCVRGMQGNRSLQLIVFLVSQRPKTESETQKLRAISARSQSEFALNYLSEWILTN